MKIKEVNRYKRKLLNLKLINTKIFHKKNLLENINIENIKYQLKKSLQVIYKYYINNKKILFTDVPTNVYNNIKFKNTKQHTWVIKPKNGILTNNSTNYIKKNKKKHDLIVIFDYDESKNIISEAYLSKIPTICLNINFNILNSKCSYKIPGNYKFSEKPIRNDFFISILEATLKRAYYFTKSKNAFQKNKYL